MITVIVAFSALARKHGISVPKPRALGRSD